MLKDFIYRELKKSQLMKDFIYIIIIISLSGLLYLGYVDNQNAESRLEITNQNLKAASSQLDTLRLENGTLLAERDIYLSRVNELENNNIINKKEIKRLERQLEGRITEVTKTEIEIEPKHSRDSSLNKTKIPLIVGFTDNNKVFINTDCPNIKINTVEGIRIQNSITTSRNNKQRRFGISIQGGLYTGYDIGSRRLYYGPGIGIGFHYRLL